jgi:predicted metalloendopeptidase
MFYQDDRYEQMRGAYKTHLQNTFALLGQKPEEAKKSAETVFSMESSLAAASMGRIELRDYEKQYNKFTKDEFFKKCTNLDLEHYLKGLGAAPFTDVIVTQPAYFEKLNEMMNSVPLADWKTYLTWNLVHDRLT